MKNEGYVTFVNSNPLYIGLTDILVESILNFSSRPIEIFSINSHYKHSSTRVKNIRIDLPNDNFATICYSKLYSSLNCSFDYGIQLDADFIITNKMDNLFDDTKFIDITPFGSLHPTDPNNQKNLMSYLGVSTKTQPYVHATYLFSNSCRPFLEECYNISKELYSKGLNPPNYDETILNVMLWKYNSNKWVDTYDIYYEIFENGQNPSFGGYPNDFKLNFYSCHGCKDINRAKKILDSLIKKQI